MGKVSTAEARKNLADLLNRVLYTNERVVVERHGKEVAAIVSMEELGTLDAVKALLADREVREALDQLEERTSIPWAELREELGL